MAATTTTTMMTQATTLTATTIVIVSVHRAVDSAYDVHHVKKNFQFIQLCNGDMNRRSKTAKIISGLNYNV